MTDKEYIEAKDLYDFRNELADKFLSLCNYNDYNKLTLLTIYETIDKIYLKYEGKPLAEAVEVVRCKDCKHCKFNSDAETYKCNRRGYFVEEVEADGFCNYGERERETL